MLEDEKTTLLDQPLDMTQIKHRQGGGGRQLAYISGKFAMDQANRIFGYGQWGYKVVSRGQLSIDGLDNSKITMYTADVELWVTGADFAFPGAGVGIVTKPYTVEMHEKAYKEAETDAMKRALRHYGDQFGLCLYDGEDYVDAGNGEMIQVKDVPIQGKPQQQLVQRRPPALTNASTTAVRLNGSGAPRNENAEVTVTEQQVASIRKLCQHIGKSEPANVASLSFVAAKKLIGELTAEYKASNTNAPKPEPASKELLASARQMYQRLGREIPADLDQKSAKVVRTLLEQMTGQYREQINVPDVKSLQARCTKLELKWETVVATALKSNVPDSKQTPEHRSRIKQFLDNVEEVRAKNTQPQEQAS